jgi:hypothetical protein
MSLTDEQARIAQAVDGEFQRLVRQGKSQATILGLMHDHMLLFKQLMDAGVMQEAADRYPGFRQYAKILERMARGIRAGAIAVPGRRAAPRQNDPMSEYRRLAAGIDLRMEQLAAEGVPVSAVIDRMAGHMPDLHRIWTSVTDDQLAMLCREYPGFYRYAALMEEAAEAERQKPARPYDDLPELPDALKEHLAALLSTAAKLERDYQAVLDAAGAPAPTLWIRPLIELRAHWEADLSRFKAALPTASVPQKSRDIIFPELDRMAQRIVELEGRVQAHRPPTSKVSGSNL